jgi:hypothetical protein
MHSPFVIERNGRSSEQETLTMIRSVSVLVVLGVVALAACTDRAAPPAEAAPITTQKEPPAAAASQANLAKRGEALVKMGGCSDCHTPMVFDKNLGVPVPQAERFFSGHPEGAPDPSATPGKGDQAVIGPTFTSFRLPFGVVYANNLTPDPETGLRMSKAQFIATMRTGKHLGEAEGRPLLPPMPWTNLQNASDEDLSAMHAYLGTLTPVKNAVPDPKVPPPVIAAMAKLNAQIAAAAAAKGAAPAL